MHLVALLGEWSLWPKTRTYSSDLSLRQGGDQNLWGRADGTILKVRNLNWLLNLWESYVWEIYPSLRKYRLCFSQISCKNVPCVWRYLVSKDKWPVRHWYCHYIYDIVFLVTFCFVSNSWKALRLVTRNSHIPFIHLHQLLTFNPMGFTIHTLSNISMHIFWNHLRVSCRHDALYS